MMLAKEIELLCHSVFLIILFHFLGFNKIYSQQTTDTIINGSEIIVEYRCPDWSYDKTPSALYGGENFTGLKINSDNSFYFFTVSAGSTWYGGFWSYTDNKLYLDITKFIDASGEGPKKNVMIEAIFNVSNESGRITLILDSWNKPTKNKSGASFKTALMYYTTFISK